MSQIMSQIMSGRVVQAMVSVELSSKVSSTPTGVPSSGLKRDRWVLSSVRVKTSPCLSVPFRKVESMILSWRTNSSRTICARCALAGGQRAGSGPAEMV